MNAGVYRRLILRDVDGLKHQLQAYQTEPAIWVAPEGISNAPGNIALHIAGNLQHYVGHVLGGTGYQRDRNAEFSRRDVPLPELLADLDASSAVVDRVLAGLPDSKLTEVYPVTLGGIQLMTDRVLAHLCGHLAYHLGQVDYHRRITTGEGAIHGIQKLAPLVD